MMKKTVMRYRANHSRASLAGPSDRSGVGTRIIAKIFQVPISSPDTMTAHWRQRDIPAGSHTLITSGRFRSSSEIEPAIDTHSRRHTPTV
jgi:hypothetical protein